MKSESSRPRPRIVAPRIITKFSGWPDPRVRYHHLTYHTLRSGKTPGVLIRVVSRSAWGSLIFSYLQCIRGRNNKHQPRCPAIASIVEIKMVQVEQPPVRGGDILKYAKRRTATTCDPIRLVAVTRNPGHTAVVCARLSALLAVPFYFSCEK